MNRLTINVCLQGMDYLEQRGIVHRDLAARNVLGARVRFMASFCNCSGAAWPFTLSSS